MTTQHKPRLHYFDMLKGMAIFMVVMGHVITMCVRGIDATPLFKFLENVHMPLFFFISGWFTYKDAPDGRILSPAWGKRALQLLLPMAVVSSLWIWYFPHSHLESPFDSTFAGLWSSDGKNGYWFTLVLFEIMLMYGATIPVLRICRGALSSVLVVLAIWAVAMYGVLQWVPVGIADCASLVTAVQFYPVFVIGAIARRHQEAFLAITGSPVWYAVCLVVGASLLYYMSWPWEVDASYAWLLYPGRVFFRICLVVVAIGAVRPWAERAFAEDTTSYPSPSHGAYLARMWQYIGTQSLAIYLLHYFFLFPMGCMGDVLRGFRLSFVPMLVFTAVAATAIITVTLGANYVISRSWLLALLLTGKVDAGSRK